MPTRDVFYSFHFDNDVFRVQQIRNMGSIDENEPVSANEWEKIKNAGDQAIKNWIEKTMNKTQCVIVLIGEETYKRPWVRHEIKRAWEKNMALFGIYIHNLKSMNDGKGSKGLNPFDYVTKPDGTKLSSVIKCYEPSSGDAYGDISKNIDSWVETAITQSFKF